MVRSVRELNMPAYWSRKDERQYRAIVSSCTRPKKTCERVAAATVNKRRRSEGRTLRRLSDFVVQAKPIPGHPRTGGWRPGWTPTCSSEPLKTHRAANQHLNKIRVEGAKYRVVKGRSPQCSRGQNLGIQALLLSLLGGAGFYVLAKSAPAT